MEDLPGNSSDQMEAPTERLTPVKKAALAKVLHHDDSASAGSAAQISCSCPGCGTTYELDPDCIGNKLSCGDCDSAFYLLDENGRTSVVKNEGQQEAHTSDGSSIMAKCPSCGNAYELSRDSIGRKLRCGICDETFMMLDLTGQTSSLSGGHNTSAASAPRQVVVSGDGIKMIACACPKCGYACELDDSRIGEKVVCSSCKSAFVLLDLSGVTIPFDDGKSRKKAVVTPVRSSAGSSAPIQASRSSGWTTGSIWMAVIGLIILVLAGIYLFHPSSPFNQNIPTSSKPARPF